MSVNPGGVEQMVWDVEGGIKVACLNDTFPLGERAAGIRQRGVKVKVA